jgi:hypothetical protein
MNWFPEKLHHLEDNYKNLEILQEEIIGKMCQHNLQTNTTNDLFSYGSFTT